MVKTKEQIKQYNKLYYQRKKEQLKQYNIEYYKQKKEDSYIDIIYKKHTKKESEIILTELCEFYFDEFNKTYYDWFNSF